MSRANSRSEVRAEAVGVGSSALLGQYSTAPRLWHHPPPATPPACPPRTLGADLPAAPRGLAHGHQSRTYLARFQTNSSVSPDDVLGLVNFSSSAVSEVMIRFCSAPPIMFANVLPSTLGVMTLSTSLIEYVP